MSGLGRVDSPRQQQSEAPKPQMQLHNSDDRDFEHEQGSVASAFSNGQVEQAPIYLSPPAAQIWPYQSLDEAETKQPSPDQDTTDFRFVYPTNAMEGLEIQMALHYTRQDCRARLSHAGRGPSKHALGDLFRPVHGDPRGFLRTSGFVLGIPINLLCWCS